jgi:hypothetical protein
MTHTLVKDTANVTVLDGDAIPLLPAHSVVIPALCIGVIPHGVALDSDGEDPSWVLMVPEPSALLAHGLMVMTQAVEDGDVITVVFNITSKEKRLLKGECVSRLVKVPGAAWVRA